VWTTVTLEVRYGLATARMSREHGNAINGQLVEDLIDACRRADEDSGVRGMILAASGKLFCPGLDLQELIELDRTEMERFVTRFADCILALYTFSKPMVAQLHSHTVAGGCVLSLTADWRVLRQGAMIGLNEVRVGVPLPYGVAMILRESVTAPHLERVALDGRNYKDAEALATGLAHEIHPAEGFEARCFSRLEELASKDTVAFAATKRYLRSPVVERIRAHDREYAREFVDSWFSPGSQARMRAIADELRS